MDDRIWSYLTKWIIINSMTKSYYKQEYVQGFDCKSISFKKAVNMFERIEVVEIIYEGEVTHYYI